MSTKNIRTITTLTVSDDNEVSICFKGSTSIVKAIALEVVKEEGEITKLVLDRLIHSHDEFRFDDCSQSKSALSFSVNGCFVSELSRSKTPKELN